MKHVNKLRTALTAAFAVAFLAGGVIYASSPITSTKGCNNMTKEHNDGHCESDGTNYFCADRNWLQSKDCVKHETAKDDTDNSTPIN